MDAILKNSADFFSESQGRYAALSDQIWHLAELSYAESASAALHIEMLRAEGFTVTTGIAGIPTAFCAEAGSGGPVIGLLGEYDALAGMSQQAGVTEPVADVCSANGHGHGCGHHLLGAGAQWAAVAVRRALAASGMPGRVRFYGCPAEEGGSGKTFMTRAGVFDDLDAALTWHPDYETGVTTSGSLANIQATFRFAGVAAHAAIAPHLGRSALDAVELMNVGVNYLREHMAPEARVHYAITDAGGKSPNVVQANAAVLYLMRSPDNALTRELYQRVGDIARGAALMSGCSLTVEFDKACSNLVFNRTLADVMQSVIETLPETIYSGQETAAAAAMQASFSDPQRSAILRAAGLGGQAALPVLGGRIAYAPVPRPGFASTDVGDVSWVTPTVQCMTTCFAFGTPFHSWQMVAQGTASLAHKGLQEAGRIMAATALRLFAEPPLLAQAQQELIERGAGRAAYQCPIPPDVAVPCSRDH